MKNNPVKQKLYNGEISVGTMVIEFNTPGIASILAPSGIDFIVYDMEHSGFSIESVKRLMSYNRGLDVTPVVRVADTQYSYMANALDAGAMGVMVPLVESHEQVQRIIQSCKYYPLGRRGTAFQVAHDDYLAGDMAVKMKQANEEMLIIVQIETELGVDRIEEIISADGIDVAWVGHNDLSQSLGIPGQFEHPRFLTAMDRIVEACNKYGKTAGRMVTDVESADRWMDKGYRCLAYSGDIWLLQQALTAGVSAVKQAAKSKFGQ